MSYIPDNLRKFRVRDKVSRTAFEIYTAFCDYADSETGFTFVSIERIADECGDIRHNSARTYLKELVAAGWIIDTFAEVSGKHVKGFSLKSEKTAWLSLSERLNNIDKKIVTESGIDKKIVSNEIKTPEIDKKIVNVDKNFVTPPYNPQEDILNTNQTLNQEKTENSLSETDGIKKTKPSSKPKREISPEEKIFKQELWTFQSRYAEIEDKGRKIGIHKALTSLFKKSGGSAELCKKAFAAKEEAERKFRTSPLTWITIEKDFRFIIELFALEAAPEPSAEDLAEQQRIAEENWRKQQDANRHFDEELRSKKDRRISGPAAAVESGRRENDYRGDFPRQQFNGLPFAQFEGGGFLLGDSPKNLSGYAGNLPNKLDH